MGAKQFNEKYKDFLEEGHYGLDLHKPEAVEYLDRKFQEFIEIPGFSYSQIKGKFNWFCFYNTGLSREKTQEVEQKLKEIYYGNNSNN